MMKFKHFLAILLLLILPLQSTLAAIDSCCLFGAVTQVVSAGAAQEEAASSRDADGEDCCTSCDYCHHTSTSFTAAAGNRHVPPLSSAPVARPEPPIHSFIPDIPPRPDRAA